MPVTHEASGRVDSPDGERRSSNVPDGEITGKQNVHVVYRADGEMVIQRTHLRVRLCSSIVEEAESESESPLQSSRRLPVTESYPQIREQATRAQEKGQYCGLDSQ